MAHFLCHLGCSHFGALLLDFHFTENTQADWNFPILVFRVIKPKHNLMIKKTNVSMKNYTALETFPFLGNRIYN